MHESSGIPIDGRNTAGKCLAAPHVSAFSRWIFLLALLLPGPMLAAGFACTQPATRDTSLPAPSQLTELDEVTITPGKSTTRSRDLSAWLKRLEGQYRYEGYVDLCGNGNAADQRPVTGKADCLGLYHSDDYEFQPPPDEPLTSLYCVVDVRWPPVRGENGVPVLGGESNLSPAVINFGVVPDLPGIQFMQIDSKGMATHAEGKLVDDTLTTRESCGMPGFCQKVTRITAVPDSDDIAMLVDIEIDSHRVLRQAFLLHRLSNIQMRRTRESLRWVGER